MPNIRVDSTFPIINGLAVIFRSPADCSQVTGLVVYYPDGNGTTSKVFKFVDAHGVDVGRGTISLFAENVLVKVVLDTDHGKAYVQNADTNAYLEGRFKQLSELEPKTGDIRETMRTNLSDNWVLCNGDVVPEGQYHALHEILPYNTAYRRLPCQTEEYPIVRALPVSGQWFFCKSVFGGAIYGSMSSQKAALYDELTDTCIEITAPTIPDALNYGIFGLTHNGNEYVLGVTRDDDTSDADIYKIYIYTSSDLTTWTKKMEYEFSVWQRSYDMTYTGSEVLIASYNGTNTSIYYLNAEMTTATRYNSNFGNDYRLRFITLPYPYWGYQDVNGGDSATYVRRAGNIMHAFFVTHYPGLAFFNNKYWIGAPLTSQEPASNGQFSIVDLTTEQVTALNYSNITGLSNCWYQGIDYDHNTREWMLYFQARNTQVSPQRTHFYIAYISEDADPREVSNYRIVEVGSLPEKMSKEQMTPNRTRLLEVSASERYLRNPNIKCLPKHEGDTYKYIYVGGNESVGGDEDDGSGGNAGGDDDNGDGEGGEISQNLTITDDGVGNVTIRMESGEAVRYTDDGAGNITITKASGDAINITDDKNGNVTIGG